jgi:hypothetical protein
LSARFECLPLNACLFAKRAEQMHSAAVVRKIADTLMGLPLRQANAAGVGGGARQVVFSMMPTVNLPGLERTPPGDHCAFHSGSGQEDTAGGSSMQQPDQLPAGVASASRAVSDDDQAKFQPTGTPRPFNHVHLSHEHLFLSAKSYHSKAPATCRVAAAVMMIHVLAERAVLHDRLEL